MIAWPLKLKYRAKNFKVVMQPLHPSGQIATRVKQGGRFTSKQNNSGVASKGKTLRPRRRVYGPF